MYQFRLSKLSFNLEPTSNLVAVIALCIALIGIACAAILIVIAEQEIGPNATTCNRLGIAAIAFSLWSGSKQVSHLWSDTLTEPQIAYTRRDYGLLSIAGISFAASLSLWSWSLTQTSVANSTLLNNMMPIFTTLGAWLLFRQQFSVKFLLGLAVAVGGAIAIGLADLQAVDSNITGDLAALAAAMLSATSILSLEQLRVRFSTPDIMLWTCAIGSACILPLALLSEGQLFPTSGVGWSAIIALALVSQVIGQGLLTYSLARFSSGFVAVSMLAIPVIAAVLAMLLFAETLSLFNWSAFAVVLIGIYLAVTAKNAGIKAEGRGQKAEGQKC